MAIKAFEVFGEIVLKADKAKKDLKDWEKGIKLVGDKMQKVGKEMTKFLTLPILGAATASVKLASDFDESLNKITVAFGDSKQAVIDWSETTADRIGMSSGAALDAAALFGDMATSMGLTQSAAADMSIDLVNLSGDLSSFKNVRQDIASTALKGIFTGETESLKGLGIVMTQAELQAFALSRGIEKNIQDMTQAEKVNLRYAFVLEKTQNAQGDFERTSDSLANQMRSLRANLEDAAVTLGTKLLPIVTPIVQKISEFVKKISELDDGTITWILRIGGLVAAIGPLTKVTGVLISNFKTLSAVGKNLFSPTGIIAAGIALIGTAIVKYTLSAQAIGEEAEAIKRKHDELLATNSEQLTANELAAEFIGLSKEKLMMERVAIEEELRAFVDANSRKIELINEFNAILEESEQDHVSAVRSYEIGERRRQIAQQLGIDLTGKDRVELEGTLRAKVAYYEDLIPRQKADLEARRDALDLAIAQKAESEESANAYEEEWDALDDLISKEKQRSGINRTAAKFRYDENLKQSKGMFKTYEEEYVQPVIDSEFTIWKRTREIAEEGIKTVTAVRDKAFEEWKEQQESKYVGPMIDGEFEVYKARMEKLDAWKEANEIFYQDMMELDKKYIEQALKDYEDLQSQRKKDIETTTEALQNFLKPAMEDIIGTVLEGGSAWQSLGKIAIGTIANILDGLGAQLIALVATHGLALDFAGAVAAGAGAAAAFAAAAALRGSIERFAEGGLVPGSPNAGDVVPAMLTGREMVLNGRQQANLFNMIDRPNLSYNTTNNYGSNSLDLTVGMGDEIFYKKINLAFKNNKARVYARNIIQ